MIRFICFFSCLIKSLFDEINETEIRQYSYTGGRKSKVIQNLYSIGSFFLSQERIWWRCVVKQISCNVTIRRYVLSSHQCSQASSRGHQWSVYFDIQGVSPHWGVYTIIAQVLLALWHDQRQRSFNTTTSWWRQLCKMIWDLRWHLSQCGLSVLMRGQTTKRQLKTSMHVHRTILWQAHHSVYTNLDQLACFTQAHPGNTLISSK